MERDNFKNKELLFGETKIVGGRNLAGNKATEAARINELMQT